MIRRVIASVAIGPHEELLNLSHFKLQEFASRYDYEVSICKKSLDITRPHAWTKILHILSLMNDYDEILWIDSDAIIIDSSKDIADDVLPECELAWVYHEYDNQTHPNSGVMYIKVNANTLKLFKFANEQHDLVDHPWWDQAALMRLLGMDTAIWPIGKGGVASRMQIKEQALTVDWNSIRRHPSRNPRIRHFAGEQFWVRKLLMAEYANPDGDAPFILSNIYSLNHPEEKQMSLTQNPEMEIEIRELRLFIDQIVNSRTWKFFKFWRIFRNTVIMKTRG